MAVSRKRFYALQTGMRVSNGDDLLDDADLDIVDDELDIDHGEEQEDRRQQLLKHFL